MEHFYSFERHYATHSHSHPPTLKRASPNAHLSLTLGDAIEDGKRTTPSGIAHTPMGSPTHTLPALGDDYY